MEDIRITEILEDYKAVGDAYTNEEKKPFMEKYNVSSKKIKDIQRAMMILANEYRKEHEVYTDQDWLVWNRLYNFPASSKKIKEACEGEDDFWIEHCIKITKKIWEGKKHYTVKDHRYEYFQKLKKEREQSQDNILNSLYNNLTIITFEFKERMYKRMLESEKNRFYYLSKFNKEEAKEQGKQFFISWVKLEALSEGFKWEIFKEKIDKNFESMFSNNIMAIAQRIRSRKEIGLSNLKLQSINEDPKFFEMILRDCRGNFIHCRSIVAAEFSDLVSAHYRFIITFKNGKI